MNDLKHAIKVAMLYAVSWLINVSLLSLAAVCLRRTTGCSWRGGRRSSKQTRSQPLPPQPWSRRNEEPPPPPPLPPSYLPCIYVDFSQENHTLQSEKYHHCISLCVNHHCFVCISIFSNKCFAYDLCLIYYSESCVPIVILAWGGSSANIWL